jgi:hypothetical protein
MHPAHSTCKPAAGEVGHVGAMCLCGCGPQLVSCGPTGPRAMFVVCGAQWRASPIQPQSLSHANKPLRGAEANLATSAAGCAFCMAQHAHAVHGFAGFSAAGLLPARCVMATITTNQAGPYWFSCVMLIPQQQDVDALFAWRVLHWGCAVCWLRLPTQQPPAIRCGWLVRVRKLCRPTGKCAECMCTCYPPCFQVSSLHHQVGACCGPGCVAPAKCCQGWVGTLLPWCANSTWGWFPLQA